MELQGYSKFVADIFLAVVSGDVVDFSVEVKRENVSHAGVHGQISEGKVRCRLDRNVGGILKIVFKEGSKLRDLDALFAVEGAAYHHVSVHANDAPVHRHEGYESPRAVNMSSVEDVVAVRSLRLPRWPCHVHFVHSFVLCDKADMQIQNLFSQAGEDM